MKEKKKTFFDSLWFNALMSVVAVAALGEKVVLNIISGDYYHNSIWIIIWIVIVYHFIDATIKIRRERKEVPPKDESAPE